MKTVVDAAMEDMLRGKADIMSLAVSDYINSSIFAANLHKAATEKVELAISRLKAKRERERQI